MCSPLCMCHTGQSDRDCTHIQWSCVRRDWRVCVQEHVAARCRDGVAGCRRDVAPCRERVAPCRGRVAGVSRHVASVSRHVAGVSRHVVSVSRACRAVSRRVTGCRSHVGDRSTCVNTSTCLKGPARLGGIDPDFLAALTTVHRREQEGVQADLRCPETRARIPTSRCTARRTSNLWTSPARRQSARPRPPRSRVLYRLSSDTQLSAVT